MSHAKSHNEPVFGAAEEYFIQNRIIKYGKLIETEIGFHSNDSCGTTSFMLMRCFGELCKKNHEGGRKEKEGEQMEEDKERE